mgnify:CR=1 FL=1
MSTVLTLTGEVSTQLAQAAPVVQAAGGGILDWVNSKSSELQTVGRGLAVTFGILFVLFQAIISRGAMARIIISGLAAAIFVWMVWNVTDLQERVDNEINAAPPPPGVSVPFHAASAPVT